MSSFFVGVGSGSACLAFCAPAILPYLLYKDEGTLRNFAYLLQFFLGRLLGYMVFGLLAWHIGKWTFVTGTYKPLSIGAAYMLVSVILVYTFFKGRKGCRAKLPQKTKLSAGYGALWMGFASGINLCPSFLLIFAEAVNAQSLFASLSVFFLFFCGTSLYFLPLPFVGLIKQKEAFKTVCRFLIVLVAAYYFYRGTVMVSGGFS